MPGCNRTNTQFLFKAAILLMIGIHIGRTAGAPRVGDSAPQITLEKLLQAPAGTEASWDKLKGKVVVLEFWATWCAPCIAAIPHLNELADRFKDKPVHFIAITDEQEKVVTKLLARKPMHAWVGLDTDKSMFKAYDVGGIPHTVLVNSNSVIAAVMHPTGLMGEHIENLLAGKPLGLPEASKNGERVSAPTVAADQKKNQPVLFEVTIRPSDQDSSSMSSGPAGKTEFGPLYGYNMVGYKLKDVLSTAFGVSSARIITNCTLPEARFDFTLKLPQEGITNLLQQALRTTFGLVSRRETRDLDVYQLKVKIAGHKGLEPTVSTGGSSSSSGPGHMTVVNGSMNSLARSLESLLKTPVFNETGLHERYDYELKWDQGEDEQPNSQAVIAALREQMGLDLAASKRSVEVVVVETQAKPKSESGRKQ